MALVYNKKNDAADETETKCGSALGKVLMMSYFIDIIKLTKAAFD